ncbi:MAG TPA: AAA family ATPase, partial [Nannocystaceae bacterium]|nr:AAA family ATPase [Nannocystaceae bacterium]
MQKLPGWHKLWLGRTRELAELEAGLDDLAVGRGSLFLLTGEPGIGKTRLADECARRAAARGAPVHWGRAWEAGGAPAFWPLLQALRPIAPELAVLDRLVAPSPTPVDRFALFEQIARAVHAAVPPPRLIVLDDLHAADASSLELLHFIVRELRTRPLMIVGTYRDAEARLADELRPLLARISREGCLLPLARLDRREVEEFVAHATGSAPSREQADELYAQTEGNPLFLRELLQLSTTTARQSEGIHEVLRARLSLIPRDSSRVLEAAAVLGREFAAAQLAAVAGITEIEGRVAVEPAAHAGLVEAFDDPPRWRFTHVLLRQALYDAIEVGRRASLHARAARWLHETAATPALAELAHHVDAIRCNDVGRHREARSRERRAQRVRVADAARHRDRVTCECHQ